MTGERQLQRLNIPKLTAEQLALFNSHIRKTTTCWIWVGGRTHGSRSTDKYGSMRLNGTPYKAHRVAWAIAHGTMPVDLEIDHKCHNTLCVNPEHLQAITHKGNMQNLSTYNTRNHTTGIRGVTRLPNGRYRVYCHTNGKQYSGGCYPDLQSARIMAVQLRDRLMSNNLEDR